MSDHEPEIRQAAAVLDLVPGGEVVWRDRGLRPNACGSFSLTLPRRTFTAGEHRLRLFGIRDGRREALGDYAFQIAP